MVAERFLDEEWQSNMKRINDCLDCGHCKANCPYELDVPSLLRSQYDHYMKAVGK